MFQLNILGEQGPGNSWWASAEQMKIFAALSLDKPYHSLFLGILACCLSTVSSVHCLYVPIDSWYSCLGAAASAQCRQQCAPLPQNSIHGKAEKKKSFMKIPKHIALRRYCKTAVVHKAIDNAAPGFLLLWNSNWHWAQILQDSDSL